MSNVQTQLPKDHPMMIAWEAYKETADFENTRKWVNHPEHSIGSLWAAFTAGYRAGIHDAE